MTCHCKAVDTSSESLSPPLLTDSDSDSESSDYEICEDEGSIGEFMIGTLYSDDIEL